MKIGKEEEERQCLLYNLFLVEFHGRDIRIFFFKDDLDNRFEVLELDYPFEHVLCDHLDDFVHFLQVKQLVLTINEDLFLHYISTNDFRRRVMEGYKDRIEDKDEILLTIG